MGAEKTVGCMEKVQLGWLLAASKPEELPPPHIELGHSHPQEAAEVVPCLGSKRKQLHENPKLIMGSSDTMEISFPLFPALNVLKSRSALS